MPERSIAAAEIVSGFRRTSPQRLRIAHVLDAPFAVDVANGVSQVVRYLARAQADRGESVAVLSGVDGLHFPDGGAESIRPSDDILAWQPDVLHFHSVHVPQHVALAARARGAGIRYCVTVHGGLFPAALKRGRLKKTVFNLLFERRFLREASFVHAVSPHEVAAIRGYGFEGPVVVVPNGLPLDRVIEPHPEALHAEYPSLLNQRVFMFIGRLDPWQKGLDLLIEAFSRAALPKAMLVLVGPDYRGSRRSLERLANRLGIASRVLFTGGVFGPRRANLLAGADVFVHPSRWEGLSLSVLGAAADGKPCLITRDADPLGALERAQAAVIVDATVPGIAAGLKHSASLSGEALQMMSCRARRVAENYLTWPEIADILLTAYQDALVAPRRISGQPHDG